mmetsp:Transcript_155649/g.276105  ORF Transcript_155649/g.276105 Transcript_155649/m.276105 type:complete len:185 (+) Transcript_155649:93-647(+)
MFCCCAATDPKATTVEAIAEEPPKTRDAPEEVKEEVVPEPQEEPVEANEPVEENAPEPEIEEEKVDTGAKLPEPVPDVVGPEPVDPEPVDNTGCILFSRDGKDVKIKFEKAPFGMTFTNKLPIVIIKVIEGQGGAAAGVQVGDVVKAIEGKELGTTFAVVQADLKAFSDKIYEANLVAFADKMA